MFVEIRIVSTLFAIGFSTWLIPSSTAQMVDDPIVKFGMEIVESNLGVRILELDGSRPIARKLREGDILVSYTVIVDGKQQLNKIVSTDSVDDLKTWIRDGQRVSVAVLRPIANGQNNFESIELEIDALDLMRPQVVEIATQSVTRTYSVTVSEPMPAIVEGEANGMIVKVHYATDRQLDANQQYSAERDLAPQPIKYGTCEVSIPPNHRRGQLESPSMWDWYRPNPRKHVFLANISQTGEEETFNSIKSILSAGAGPKSVIFFVHGYNVSFEDAARRSAQLHFDLNYSGVSLFYSWPSNATLGGYLSDAEDIAWSTKHIEAVLEKLCDQPEIEQIHVIAHSMGNRGVTGALVSLANKDKTKKIGEVILCAADVDAAFFERDIAPAISNAIARTTIYASDKDKALKSSKAINGNARLGEIRNGFPTIKAFDRIDLIDASNVETDFLGHSYYGDVSLIGDLFTLLGTSVAPPRQFLIEKQYGGGRFWAIKR